MGNPKSNIGKIAAETAGVTPYCLPEFFENVQQKLL